MAVTEVLHHSTVQQNEVWHEQFNASVTAANSQLASLNERFVKHAVVKVVTNHERVFFISISQLHESFVCSDGTSQFKSSGKRVKDIEVVDDVRVAEGADNVDNIQVVKAVGSVGDFEVDEDVSGFEVVDCAGDARNVKTFDTPSIGVNQAGEVFNDLGVSGRCEVADGVEVAEGAKVVEISDCVELIQAVDDDAKAIKVFDGGVKVTDGV
ncbi:hypothetical protein PoB_007087400 [Plakobranchus ocellatus]|uniref:Uncharacterized protein n=1 Tax=Plakobranchus ocellatus TaxID=259542 RepID=A0AAV4DK21_9GAST|nr:hypothetical protein PoB_007087400 [Plakobranchus ocellatus]